MKSEWCSDSKVQQIKYQSCENQDICWHLPTATPVLGSCQIWGSSWSSVGQSNIFGAQKQTLQSTDCDKRSVGLNNYSFVIRSKSTWLLIEECWTASVLRSPLWISTSCQLQEVSTAAGAGAPQPGGILQKPQCVASQSWVNIFSKPRLHKTFERMTPEFCTCHAESLCSVFHQTFLKGTLNSVHSLCC